MPRDVEKYEYYTVPVPRNSPVHRLIETGIAGVKGKDFILAILNEVAELLSGKPAVLLAALLAAAKIPLPPSLETGPREQVTQRPPAQPAARPPGGVLGRAALARRSKMYADSDEENEGEA